MQIMGLTIGVVPQFRKLLVADNALFHVVQDTITMLGWVTSTTRNYYVIKETLKYTMKLIGCTLYFPFFLVFRDASVPAMVLLLGANLVKGNHLSTNNMKFSTLPFISWVEFSIVVTFKNECKGINWILFRFKRIRTTTSTYCWHYYG